MKNLFLIVTGILFLGCEKDDTPTTITTANDLTTALEALSVHTPIPGFTVATVKNGSITYQNSFGNRNEELELPYTNQTLQSIGSISKTFIAVAVVKCIELGLFDLETPINDILPQPINNPLNTNSEIRIKHLVQHSSGLVDNPNTILSTYYLLPNQDLSTEGAQLLLDAQFEVRSPRTLQALIEDYYYPSGNLYQLNNFTSNPPGTAYSYSNIASSLTAYLIELRAQMPYSEFVQTYILEPLAMDQTGFEYHLGDPGYAYSNVYFEKNIPFPFYSCDSYPDGFIKTNNDDLSKFLEDMIKGNMGISNTLFAPNYYQMLFTETAFNHSIFWILNGNTIEHSGGDPGISCNLAFDKIKNQGYFILTNYDVSTAEHQAVFQNFIQNVEGKLNQFLNL
ncbi:beta-lactamase family protein [Flavobacterium sp. NRK F10]|uniref:serine hydrolase domain-containing protein n=1 Tax=Flavobacterium sp. NRK F10 TaxID=2954931 RepID=UPI002090ADA9|nr:serine hydrolase [Flavobacterium sp. NRK F10]MCO6173422.1 beta-lactamase family protein [Flavobacterium sp. NRK F10]